MTDATPSPHLDTLRAYFDTGATRSAEWRRAQLDGLLALCRERETEIVDALHADLGKHPVEAFASEVAFIASHARHARRRLPRWMRKRKVSIDLANLPGRAWLEPQARGVVLIMAPWNYPFHLSLSPLIGALAAGNCAVIKPSEFAPATAALLADLLPRYLDPRAIRVVTGDADVAQELLTHPFDLIFFTGSTAVGRKVMQAAAHHLTPVVLELGGKSPTIVTHSADIEVAARRIAWGKCLNAGQTCIAPDHVFLEPGLMAPFIDAFKKAVRGFLGPDPAQSPHYARIVNRHHFARLTRMLDEGTILHGGRRDAEALFIEPTVLGDLPDDAAAMGEEIFGPILPVFEVPDVDTALSRINDGAKPLALYLFSADRAVQQRVLDTTSSGGVVFNDVVMHVTPPDLPFGGVGASGMGRYHGDSSFETFTHLRPVLRKGFRFDVPVRYPPYSARKARWLRRLM